MRERRGGGARRAWFLCAVGSRILQLVPHATARTVRAGQHDIQEADGLPQRLKGGPAAHERAVRPGKQYAAANIAGQRRKRREAANGEEGVQTRVTESQELHELRAVRGARIEIQPA